MPALHIRDVPEPVVAALRERATRHGQSMQRELRQILQATATTPVAAEASEPVGLTTVRTGGGSIWSREEIYGDAGR